MQTPSKYSLREILTLFFIRGCVSFFQIIEALKTKIRFYSYSNFRRCDRLLRKKYCGLNPYRICKNFLYSKNQKEGDAYGETPLTTLAKIADEGGLTQEDYFIDLGCGRGRGVFFLSCYTGCKAKGIEWVPFFVDCAEKIATECSLNRITFSCEDISKADLKEASFIYLYGTCLEEEDINQLIHTFHKLKKGTKILTISYPLTDSSSFFILKKQFSVSFPWGKTEAYLQEKS